MQTAAERDYTDVPTTTNARGGADVGAGRSAASQPTENALAAVVAELTVLRLEVLALRQRVAVLEKGEGST